MEGEGRPDDLGLCHHSYNVNYVKNNSLAMHFEIPSGDSNP
jgi:hypothetical protein